MRRPYVHRARRKSRAQAIVELVLVLPVLLALILGLVSVGQLLLANFAVNQAVRAAAHQAALGGGDVAAAYAAAELVLDSGAGMRAASADIRVSCPHSPCRRYDPVTVSITYAGEYWAPLPPLERFRVAASATRAAERDQQ